MEQVNNTRLAEAVGKKAGGGTETAVKNRYVILGIVLTGILMSVLDGNVVGVALPTLTQTFNVDLSLSQWTATAYLLTITSTLLIFGKLSEYTGKVKMYIAGFVIFTLGSLACGLAPGIYELIGFRVFQGIGGAMVAGLGGAILFSVFPPRERGRAMGYIGAVSGVGCILGPGLGGFLVEHFGWGSVFLINVPIGIVLIPAAIRYLKVPETITGKLQVDWMGAASLIVATSALMLLLNELGFGLNVTSMTILYAVAFAGGLALFVASELRAREPLIDLSVFREMRFSLPLVGMLASFTVTLLVGIVLPFYLQLGLGYSASVVGYIMFVPPAIMIVGAPIGGLLVDRRPWKYYSTAGMAVMAVSLAAMGFFATQTDLAMIMLALVVYGIGASLFTSPNTNEVMSALPRQMTGIASSVAAMTRNLGMGLGVSLAAVIMTLQLSASGNPGAIFMTAPAAMADAVSVAMYAAAALCVVGALVSFLRYTKVAVRANTGVTANN
jgi:EmrB/QacA subfamily drug resistance transporter